MIKVTFILFILSLSLTPAFAQSNQSDTLTITTYYPSPYGVYGTLEVRKGMAVGGKSSATVANLKPGQLYVGNSTILNPLDADPPVANSKTGQVIYNHPDKMLKFFDGTKWVNATAPAAVMAPICGPLNGQILSAAPPSTPASGLCALGNPSAVSGAGPWTWTCTNGGATAPCTANKCTPIKHWPPKTCSEPAYCVRDQWGNIVLCGCTNANPGCTTPETWGSVGGTCTYGKSECRSLGHLNYGWVATTAVCTQTVSDYSKCP